MCSRELGEGLRQAVYRARFNGKQVAHLLGWSPSWVSRLLSGKRNANALHVSAFLAVCRVTGVERDRLLALCQDRHTPGWLQQHGSQLPQQVVTLIDHEDNASTISEFQAMLVPGLLQTGDYARVVIQDSRTVPVEEIEDRVVARLARQSLFSRNDPARFTFYLHEFVLRLPIGGPVVMPDQLHHLLRMSVRPYLTLRVVPAAIGGTPRSVARRDRRVVQAVPGAARGDRRLPVHPGSAGRHCPERGRIERSDCHRGNRALRGSRGIMTTAPGPDGIVWRTSSYSANGGDCVEVAPAPEGVLVRDSKDRTGPAVAVPTAAWHAFLGTITP